MKKNKRIQNAWICKACGTASLKKVARCRKCQGTDFEKTGSSTTQNELMNKRKPSWCCKKCKAWRDDKPNGAPCAYCLNRTYYYFASQKEANRFKALLTLELLGEITNIETQVKYPLIINGVEICDYYADFRYTTKEGNIIVEDTKPDRFSTDLFKIKQRLVKALYDIDIKIV